MPTFEQLLTARLGPLDTAVTQWTEMIGKLTSPLQTDASAMKSKAEKSSWKGENATVTKEFVTKTAKEFSDAVIEAESVRDLLRDAHSLFKSAQDDLKYTYENPPTGIIIYPDGVLSHRVHPDRRSADSTEPVATEAQFEALRDKIDGILKRANEADELCAWGLRALIRNHPNDFGSTDLGGVADAKRMRAEEKQQAENGREAAKLYARWEHLDDTERERLLVLAEEGKDSPAFAEQLMTNLSYRGRDQQEAVLLLAGGLESGGLDGQVSSTDARLYKALSGSLATATGPDSSIGSPGGITSAWTNKLITTARDGNGLPARHPGALKGGDETLKDLTDLMAADAGDEAAYDPNKDPKEKSSPWRKDAGDPVYSEAFLTQVGDTIREWETDNDDAYDGVMKNWQGTQADPMKGLLNAMSRNPSASTHYFDPNTTDNLKYFLEDREWPGGAVESKMPDESQYTSARAELGLALESAATGRAPGSPMHPVPVHHDAAETAIFERVMSEYTEGLHKDQSAVPVSMRLPMADMIADYGSDVHQILGKKMDGPTDFNQIEIDRGDLTRIIRATAEDPNAYKIIHASQSVVTAEGLDRFPADSFRKEDPELRAWVKQSASVLGHLDGVRGDVIYDLGQAEKDANAYKRVLNYHIVGGLLTPIPIAGDAIQRSVDAGLNNHLNDENARVDAETRNNMIRHYDYSEKQMYGMLRKMATERGLSKNELDASPGEYEDHLQAITEQWYQNGMGDADKWMGQ
ncbi:MULTISPECIES: DUF6571 family protein [Streptomyces]|uniref:DUF6571 domain-containing protein n=2 Tax=Streptomyces TaxID=1883 RepID=A0ABU2RGI5_9ACTN|nr:MULTISPECIES: DUF6571 family protein [unclassified Streptomyces]MBK3594103.1 hypothetical protein [Streptomyces sp. MBT51]MDT0426599.1 hypothetical protein [Streptomyces sp. DSM 41770]MYU34585.1 hypothetical protein [Streptomyces sp. SID8358]